MRRNRLTVILFAWVSLGAPVLAAPATSDESVTALPIAQCDLPQVIGRLQLEPINKMAATSTRALPLIEELRKINSKAKDSKKPLGEQISLADADRYREISTRISAMQAANLVESLHERDLRVLLKWAQLADAKHRWGTEPKQGDPDFTAYGLLILIQLAFTSQEIDPTIVSGDKCSLQLAIQRLENPALERLSTLPFKEESARFQQILAKNKQSKLDLDKLPPADRDEARKLMAAVAPAYRERDYIMTLEYLKIMATVADLMYVNDVRDVVESGGDVAAIGSTTTRLVNEKKIPVQQQIAAGIWSKTNELIPSEQSKYWEAVSKELDKLNKK